MPERPDMTTLPSVRGTLVADAPLAPYSWLRVGGPADALFLPADEADLADFLAALDPDIPVTVLGVGSNVIIRDGGVAGVVIRLAGKHWGSVERSGDHTLTARAGTLDLQLAKTAGRLGLSGLEFFSGIPGTLGGNMVTNAGCYGRELKDVLVSFSGIDRTGTRHTFHGPASETPDPAITFDYRHANLPEGLIITELTLTGDGHQDPADITAHIEALQAKRETAQPIREKTSGSTFANPDPPYAVDPRSAWKLIDAAGLRGARVGGAQVSQKHCNFLINTGTATATELEALGELVRARVAATADVDLRWEVRRIGRVAGPQTAETS